MECPNEYRKKIIIVDLKGKQYKVTATFCLCQKEAAALVQFGFWPSSPLKPMVAFKFDFMELLESYMLECQVSLKGFCEAVKWSNKDSFVPVYVANIYKILTGECFEEYRYFRYNRSTCQDVAPGLLKGTECPLCPSQNEGRGTAIFSLDGNLDTSGGKRQIMMIYSSLIRRIWINLSAVTHQQLIGISYPVYMMEKLTERFPVNKTVILYDIACTLDSHLQKNANFRHLADNVQFRVPVFHCHGHRLRCQVLYSPRKIVGVELTDGETMEHLWSVLRQFKKITKEMSSDQRTDLPTDGLLHYTAKLQSRVASHLCVKYKRASDAENQYENDLKINLSKIPGASKDDVAAWMQDEKQQM